MSATEHGDLLRPRGYAELMDLASERTRAILDRGRRAALARRRGWLMRRVLLLADVAGLSLAFTAAQVVWTGSRPVDHVPAPSEAMLFLATLPLWVVVAKSYGLYDHDEERTGHSTTDDLVGVLNLVTVGTWIVFVLGHLFGLARPELPRLVAFWALAVTLVPGSRVVARALARKSGAYLQNAVIVGAGRVGQLVAQKIVQHPEYGLNLIGFVDTTPRPLQSGLEDLPLLGSPHELPTLVRLFDVERVVIAFSRESHEDVLDLIRVLNDMDVQVDIVPRLFEVVGPGVGIHTVEGLSLVGLRPFRLARSSRLLKRGFDLALSGIGLALLAPVLLVIACAIKLGSPGPVFFRQIRVGADDRPFRIYKFRTMTVDAESRKADVAHLNMHSLHDARMFKVPGDPRVTRIGRVLRRYSLDELPQLINVVKGEMSLVGPRPLILDEDCHVADWARRRLRLKPGITGLWQVLGSSDIPFHEMTRLDYLYVTSWSIWSDLRLILRTVPAIFRTRQAY